MFIWIKIMYSLVSIKLYMCKQLNITTKLFEYNSHHPVYYELINIKEYSRIIN